MANPFTTCETDAVAVSALPHSPEPLGPYGATVAAEAKVMRWFPANFKVTMGNAVVPYIYGVCALRDIGAALATATAPNHRIYLLGWGTDVTTELRPSGVGARSLKDLLQNTKAQVRAMFWKNPDGATLTPEGGSNVAAATFINSLPNGAAILDEKLPELVFFGNKLGVRGGGVHHQKLVVVVGQLGVIAFAGGMDLNSSRLFRSAANTSEPLHDVHVRIAGEAGLDLLRVFRDRWLDHPEAAPLDYRKFKMQPDQMTVDFDGVKPDPRTARALPSSTGATRNASTAVAVGRTFADLKKVTKQKLTYGFRPGGEHAVWDLVEAGVQAAQWYIYIEDQYFMSRRLTKLLADKLKEPRFKFLLVLMHDSRTLESSPDLATTDPNGKVSLPNEIPYLIGARNDIRKAFTTSDPTRAKWRMFCLTNPPDIERHKFCGAYVHSKTMIFDDQYVITGSANASDRAYTFDTEIVVGITDDIAGRVAGQHLARDLRVNLWHKHLGVTHGQLVTWPRGLPQWLTLPRTAMVNDISAPENSPMLGPAALLSASSSANSIWRQAIDPDLDALLASPP